MRKSFLYLSLCINCILFSQTYSPLDTTDYKQREELLKTVESQLEEIKKNIKKEYKGDLRKEIDLSYTEIFELIENKVEDKEIVFNQEFSDYINAITDEIVTSNSNAISNKSIKAYITKHNSPNALSAGNGYIFLNMGLFKYLKNEAQLASVLCHEMAHDILEHSKNSIINSAEQETSDEKKSLAKKIRRTKYNRSTEAFGAFKKILYADKKKNRKQEVEADSLGFILFKNTKYNPKSFLNALVRLSEIDSLPNIELKKETYQTFFNVDNQPFNEEWMKMEDFNAYNYNHYQKKINEDSIRSHPEIFDRIDFVKKRFNEDLEKTNDFTNTETYKELKKIASYEDVMNLFYAKQYGLSTYLTLFRLEKKPEDKYYKKVLGKNFTEIYKAKKGYKLNKYVEQLNPNKQEESYVQFLNFMWNLRLEEIKNIADYYSK